MRLLLDAHVLLWFLGEPGSLAPDARAAIIDATEVAVSSASMWEISTKVNRGRLEIPSDDIPGEVADWGFETLPISAQHAWAAGALPFHHRDPFDRILVAQAQFEGLTIVTRDPRIAQYQVAVLAA
jgi:PIN domain nuclease of toxin-antitoxin system